MKAEIENAHGMYCIVTAKEIIIAWPSSSSMSWIQTHGKIEVWLVISIHAENVMREIGRIY